MALATTASPDVVACWVFSVGPDAGKTDTIEQAEFRRQDRQKAINILGLSLLIAGAVAAAGYFIPL